MEVERPSSPCWLERSANDRNIDQGLDTITNPYRYEEQEIIRERINDDKIVFDEPLHKYSLQDRHASYPGWILSGSKVSGYLECFQEAVTRSAGAKKMPPMKEILEGVHGELQMDLMSKVSAKKFVPHVTTFKKMLQYHIGHFPHQQGDILPLTCRERSQRFLEYEKKIGGNKAKAEMSHFLPGVVYRKLEWYLIKKECLLEPDELRLLWRYLDGECSLPIFKDQELITEEEKITEKDILFNFFRLPALNGTKLHSYIEARILGMSKEDAARMYPVPETEDITQVEAFFEQFPIENIIHAEYRVGSFRHKICGSVDAIAQDPYVEDQVMLVDWKRAFKLIHENVKNFIRPRGYGANEYVLRRGVKVTDGLRDYMIQLATYRKLLILNGFKVSSTAYLVVFHPTRESYERLEIDLTDVIVEVEGIFHEREVHIKKLFSEGNEEEEETETEEEDNSQITDTEEEEDEQ